MTNEYLLKRMLQYGKKLRQAQKAYYASKDFHHKKQLLEEAKRAEKEFDNLLTNAEQLVKQ